MITTTKTSYKVVEMEASGKVLKVYGNFTPMSDADAKKYKSVPVGYLFKQASDTCDRLAAMTSRPKATPTSAVRIIVETTITSVEVL